MEKTMIALILSEALSFLGMAVAVVFNKSRLVNLFFLACMTLGGVALVLSFIGMLLNL